MRTEKLIENVLSSGMKYTIPEARKLLYYMVNPEEIKKDSDYHKFLFFEMYPLLYLGEFLQEVKWIRFSGTKERYDGEVKFLTKNSRQKIEFVRAVDSEEEALKSQTLKIMETFPDYQPEAEPVITDGNMLFKELKGMKWLWRKALRLKATKNLKTKQYAGVWLGIVFDDTRIPKSSHKKLRKRAKKVYKKHEKLVQRTFGRIFFIGLSGNFIFDSNYKKTQK